MAADFSYIKPIDDVRPDNWMGLLREDIFPFALRLTERNHADAEDLTQEAVIRVGETVDQLRDADNLTGWVCTVVRNLWNDHLRKVRRRVPTVRLTENVQSPDPPSTDEESPDVPGLPRKPDPRHWVRDLLQGATEKRRDFAEVAAALDFDRSRIAEELRKTREYAGMTPEYAGRKIQDLKDWVWNVVGLLPFRRFFEAYEQDPAYSQYNMSSWRLLPSSKFRSSLKLPVLPTDPPGMSCGIEFVLLEEGGHFSLADESSVVRAVPCLHARLKEFRAIDRHYVALLPRMPWMIRVERIKMLRASIRDVEDSLEIFSREGLKRHIQRVSDHHRRLEALLKDVASENEGEASGCDA